MEQPLPQRQRASALCRSGQKWRRKGEVFWQVIHRPRFVGTGWGSGMQCASRMGVWETPEGSLALYRSSPELRATRGVMTWFAGHDYSSGWKWINVSVRHSNSEPSCMCTCTCTCTCTCLTDPAFAWPIVRRRSRSGQSSEESTVCASRAARCALCERWKGEYVGGCRNNYQKALSTTVKCVLLRRVLVSDSGVGFRFF